MNDISAISELNLEIKRLNRLRLRGSLALSPAFALIVLFAGRDLTWKIPMVESSGILLILAALGLRLWALGCIDGNKKRVLVTWGPYRYLRHPLYCGSMLFALGTCLVAGSLMAACLWFLAFLVLYLPVLRTEERFLAVRFGAEWAAYSQQTRMLVPKTGSQLPRVEKPFRLRRPLREIAVLVLLPGVAFGVAAMIRYLDSRYNLPDWFF